MYQLVSHLVRRLAKPLLFGIMVVSIPLAGIAAGVNPAVNGSAKDLNKSALTPRTVKKTVVNPGVVAGRAKTKTPCICGYDENGVETCTPKGCGLQPFPSESSVNAATMKPSTRTTTTPRR